MFFDTYKRYGFKTKCNCCEYKHNGEWYNLDYLRLNIIKPFLYNNIKNTCFKTYKRIICSVMKVKCFRATPHTNHLEYLDYPAYQPPRISWLPRIPTTSNILTTPHTNHLEYLHYPAYQPPRISSLPRIPTTSNTFTTPHTNHLEYLDWESVMYIYTYCV
jgi:hypothetical protein